MNLLSWNCRGLGNLRTVRILGDLIKSLNPAFVFLSETLVDKGTIAELCLKPRFADFFAVDKVGRGGGLAVLWKHTVECKIMDHSNNHINVHFIENNCPVWRLSCYYGFPERSRKHNAWNFLRRLAMDTNMPWCIFGDFNDLLYSTDKRGEHPHPPGLLEGFREAIEGCNLVELELKGGQFTWEKSKGKTNWVKEKLDRAFATEEWWRKFPLWFKEEVSVYWRSLPATNIIPKLMSVSEFMAKWGRAFFHKFRDKVRCQKEVLNSLVNREDDAGVKLYFEEREKLNELLLHEEVYWKQRAKTFWLQEGDANSRYFHAQASKRRRLNKIPHLINDEGLRVEGQEEMNTMTNEYFTNIFTASETLSEKEAIVDQHIITETQNERLVADVSFEEFTEAVK
ncbi:uncharacterized protein LOC141679392 [Apium graveolens]|uniref:uncharacterized protein LOC141679392 n=1 Tax=Apium graveolens TaxID=4045 RepID=UPI003D78E95E